MQKWASNSIFFKLVIRRKSKLKEFIGAHVDVCHKRQNDIAGQNVTGRHEEDEYISQRNKMSQYWRKKGRSETDHRKNFTVGTILIWELLLYKFAPHILCPAMPI